VQYFRKHGYALYNNVDENFDTEEFKIEYKLEIHGTYLDLNK